MNRFVRCAIMATLLTSAASTAVVIALEPADAAQARGAPAKAAPKQNNVSRREIGLPINDAVKALQAMDFATALAKIQIADKVDKKTPYEEYLVAKYLGIVALGQPMRDFPMATTAYNRMIASGGVPMMGTPACSRATASFSGVCPPNCTTTPKGFSFSTISSTSSRVSGSK